MVTQDLMEDPVLQVQQATRDLLVWASQAHPEKKEAWESWANREIQENEVCMNI